MKSSITSNIDIKIDPNLKAETEYLDGLESQIDDHVRSEDAKGEAASGYQYLGAVNPNGVSITDGHRLNNESEIRRRRDANIPVIPMYTIEDPETGDPIWILNDDDAAAANLGYLCPNCLSWQESIIDINCKTPRGFGCTYVRID